MRCPERTPLLPAACSPRSADRRRSPPWTAVTSACCTTPADGSTTPAPLRVTSSSAQSRDRRLRQRPGHEPAGANRGGLTVLCPEAMMQHGVHLPLLDL